MHPLKPFYFTLQLLLLLLSLSTQLHAEANTQDLNGCNIEQVTLNHNNNSFGSEYDDTVDTIESSSSKKITIESEIFANKFRYLMEFGVKIYDGDLHPHKTYAIPDTGSDLIWLYGKSCTYKQGKDCYCETYKENECIEKPKDCIYCEEQKCQDLKKINIESECGQENHDGLCKYSGKPYADGTELKGIYGLANYLFTTNNGDDEIKLKIGLSTSKKQKDEEEPKSQGIVGLGLGQLSLINQYKITPEFSYYLPQFGRKDEKDIKALSKFTFGQGVKISDQWSTPLLTESHSLCKIRYCIHLKSIFVGESENNKITVSDDTHEAHKVMIIDSGHTFTHLSKDIFKEFLKKVEKELDGKEGEKKGDYHKCFEKDGNVEKLKKISFEFKDTKIELKRENFFDDYTSTESNGEEKHYMCLTVEGENKKYHQRLRNYGKSEVKPHILGSRAQMDFLVAFSLIKNKKVSFEDKIKHIEELSVLSE